VRPYYLFALLAIAAASRAQPVIVPNLGQWTGGFRAKTALADGAIFWTDQGYRIRVVHPKHRGGAVANPHYPTTQWPEHWPDAHALFVEFVGANPQASSSGSAATPSPRHYLLGSDPSRWTTNVPEYEDWRTSNAAEGALRLATPMGTWIEDRPVAYTLGKSGKTPVAAAYRILSDSTVSFELGPYRRSDTLVIDPNLVFSSFSGSTADNWGYTATYDNQENLYGGGIVFDVGYPTTPGAFDASYNDATSNFSTMDIGLTKFSANGSQRLYSTYVGGNGPDQPHSMMVTSLGELVVMGTTGSSNFPVTAGAYDVTFNGGPPVNGTTGSPLAFDFKDGVDLFVLKMNASGSALSASTFVGTAGNEGLNLGITLNYGDALRGEVVVDNMDQVFVVTSTQSSSFPGATGNNLSTDAVAFSLNPSLSSLRWATLLGGSNHESGYGIKTDQNGKVFVTGGTRSVNFPSTTGGLHATARGGVDGWIARLSSTGTLEKATYLGT